MKYRHKQTNTTTNLSDYEEVKETEKNWKPKDREWYFYLDTSGRAVMSNITNDYVFEYRYNTLNCFQTQQQAEAYRDYLLALGKVTRRINELNKEWPGTGKKKIEIVYDVWNEKYTFESHVNNVEGVLELPAVNTEGAANAITFELTPELGIIRNWRG